MARLMSAASLALALSIAGAALAQNDGMSTESYAYSKDTWPAEVLKRPLTLAQGLAQLSLPVNFNLSTDAVGKPVYVPALLAYGVTDSFTLALTHNNGLCLTGTSNGCPKVYNDVGLQGVYSISPRGDLQAALIAGVQLPSLSDPFVSAVVVGFDSRYTTGSVALRFDPRLAIGLSGRDSSFIETFPQPVDLDFHGAPVIGGNRETLFLPVALQVQPAANVALTLGSGVAAQLDPATGTVGDSVSVPIGLSAAYTASRFDFGASFGFPNLRASGTTSATDLRVGQVFASVRL
jgi:hypothetical protein